MSSQLVVRPTSSQTRDHLLAARTTTSRAERDRLESLVAVEFMPLADAIARRYTRRGVDDDDLLGVARLALVHAMRRYDPDVGDFAAFAKATISGELKKHFRDRAWSIRPPRRLSELRGQVASCRDDRLVRGLPAGDRDVAADLGVEVELVTQARQLGSLYAPASLDAPVLTEDGAIGGTGLADPSDAFSVVEDLDELRSYLAVLDERERMILRLRFVDELRQTQIAALLGCSQVHVSRTLARILAKVRDAADEQVAA